MFGQPTTLSIEAHALCISAAEHVNKMPFSGVLFRVGEAFDVAMEGGARRRVVLCRAGAEAAARSLIAMGVTAAADLDSTAGGKVGLITSAHLEGNAVMVEGFVYAADFASLARVFKTDQHEIGFEAEARATVSPGLSAAAELDALTFIGAKLVRRSAAISWPTSIAASAQRRTISANAAYVLQRGSVPVPRYGEKLTFSQAQSCVAGIDDPVRRLSLLRTLEREGLA